MCANFKPISKPKILQLGLDLQTPNFELGDDIYPSYDSALLFHNPNTANIEWRSVKFGLVPKWAKNLDICRYTYNARTETVHVKPSFSHAWQNNQFALIPVEIIYEPRYIDGKAQRWGISRKDGKPFTVAGLFENTTIDGQQVRSMTMLTINADQHPFMSQFHHPNDEKRSIIVIPEQHRKDWLNTNYKNAPDFFLDMSDEFTAKHMPRPQKISPQHDLF